MARRDLDDDALSTGATDTELIELPSTTADSPGPPTRDGARCIGATYVPKIDGDLDDDVEVPVALSGDLDEVVAALEALDIAALRPEFNDSAAAASRGAEEGADAGSGDVDYSGDVVEDGSSSQDAAADQGLSA